MIEDESEEVLSYCTKKKMNEKNRVVTISQGQRTRNSKVKNHGKKIFGKGNVSGSDDDIRDMLKDF